MFYILVHIKTRDGSIEIGRYFLGRDKSFAMETFFSLQGYDNKEDLLCIRLDLVYESPGALPLWLKSIACRLSEYTHNCALLTKEIFRHFMLEDETP